MAQDTETPLLGEQTSVSSGRISHKGEHHSAKAALEHEMQLWDKYECQDFPNMFSHLELAKDGGFSEVKDLYAAGRWVSALMLAIFVVYNVFCIIRLDLSLMGPGRDDAIKALGGDPAIVFDSFYVSDGLVDWLGAKITGDPTYHVSPVTLLGSLELAGLFGYLCWTVYGCIMMKIKDGYQRWYNCQVVFWDILPALSTYSAIKLLNNIVPAVASSKFAELLAEFQERSAEKKSKGPILCKFFFWVFMLFFGFMAGFDTFLMKLRIVAARANAASGILACIQFLVQILGVVQLGPFVRKRLFVFIFGGEDGVMQDEEVELMDVWNSLLARRLWRELTGAQFFAVMCSFSDVDFQGLVLNENEEEKVKQLGT